MSVVACVHVRGISFIVTHRLTLCAAVLWQDVAPSLIAQFVYLKINSNLGCENRVKVFD